jgi:hypothetical protein
MFQDLSVAIRVTDEKSPRFAKSMTHGTFLDQAARFMPKPYWEGTGRASGARHDSPTVERRVACQMRCELMPD